MGLSFKLFFIIYCLIGLLCAPHAHATTEASDVSGIYSQAKLLAGQKDFFNAKPLYEQVVSAEPGSAEAHNGLGYVCYELGDLNRAESEYIAAIVLDPGLAQAYNNLGIVNYHRANYASAEVYYKKAIELKPNYAKAMINLASTYVKTGNYWGAYLEYCGALNADKAYVEERKKSVKAQEEIKDLQNKYANGELTVEAN
jgi:Flp pilus assembly protein TadD